MFMNRIKQEKVRTFRLWGLLKRKLKGYTALIQRNLIPYLNFVGNKGDMKTTTDC